MSNEEYLIQATKRLKEANISTARLDSLLIMEFVLQTDRAKLLASPGSPVNTDQKIKLDKLISKRIKHIPIPYIVQRTEFYGRNFYINEKVLVPRPESETMIDLFKQLIGSNNALKDKLAKHGYIRVADIGTGSGVLGITAKLEVKDIRVDLIDIDPKAIEVAKKNVVLHTIDVNVIKSDLLNNTSSDYDVLLCNLPYVPDDFNINLAATHEPRISIYGGHDGLEIYHKLFKSLHYRQHIPLYILSEALPISHKHLEEIANKYDYVLQETDDFIQVYKSS